MCMHMCARAHTHTRPLCEEALGQSKNPPHSFYLTFITLGRRPDWDHELHLTDEENKAQQETEAILGVLVEVP